MRAKGGAPMNLKQLEKELKAWGAVSLEPLPDGSCPLCRMLGVKEEDGIFIDILPPGNA
jgi:hypothetical protein